MFQSVIVYHGHVVDVRHGEGNDVIVVGVVDIHSSDFNLACVKQELAKLWRVRKYAMNPPLISLSKVLIAAKAKRMSAHRQQRRM